MEFVQAFEMYENIVEWRKFYESYGQSHGNYENTLVAFDKLLFELDDTMVYGKMRMLAKSRMMTESLIAKDLDMRREFVEMNKLHELDVQNLVGTISANISQIEPVLELFPGSGQFLPYAVAGEPLYVVDRYAEIIDEAAKSIDNDFYVQNRLLKYTVDGYNLSNLPQESFGLVYCFNEFYHADEGYIYIWAREIYNLLHKGGKFIFNFLQHDEIWSMKANFNLLFSVVDYKSLMSKLEELGYEIESYKIQQFRSSYIIAKKPGEAEPRHKVGGSSIEIIDT